MNAELDPARKKAIERIQKMLRLAEGNANQHEAEVAASMAAKLMAKYNIEYADVIADEIRNNLGENIVEVVVEETEYKVKIPTYYNALVTQVSELLCCESVYTKRWNKIDGGYCPAMLIRGYKDDVIVAVWLCTYILRQVEELATLSWKREEYPALHDAGVQVHASRRRSYKDNYKYGLVIGLADRLEEVYAKEQETAAEDIGHGNENYGNQLAVIKAQAIAEVFGTPAPKRKTIGGQNNKAMDRGYNDSDRVNINRVVHNDSVKFLSHS